jgi:hypothetical protein
MATRIVALVILFLVMAFVAVMASVSFFVRDPLPILAPNQTLVLETSDLTPTIRAEIALDGDFEAGLTIAPFEAVERVRLRPVGGDDLPLTADGAAARVQFLRVGRHELIITTGQGNETLGFILRD